MSKFIVCLLLSALVLLYFRPKLKGDLTESIELMHMIPTKMKHVFQANCTMTSCLNLSKCIYDFRGIGIYVAPLVKVFKETESDILHVPSMEFLELRETIKNSEYYEPDPSNACFTIPGIDFLNQNLYKFDLLDDIYSTVKERYAESNLLIISLAGRSLPLDSAILASAQPVTWNFRSGFDLSIPFVMPVTEETLSSDNPKRHDDLLVSIDGMSDVDLGKLRDDLGVDGVKFSEKSVLNTKSNAEDTLLHDMKMSKWCLVHERQPGFEIVLWLSMKAGCLPIIFAPSYELPFSEVLRWDKFSLIVVSPELIRRNIESFENEERMNSMRDHQKVIFDRYMSSWSTVILTAIRILEERILPNKAQTVTSWNMNMPPILQPRLSPSTEFTLICESSSHNTHYMTSTLMWAGRRQSIHKAILLTENGNELVVDDLPNLHYPLVVASDVRRSTNFATFLADKVETEAVLFVPRDVLPPTTNVDVLMAIWRENPSEILIHAFGDECREIYLFHKNSRISTNEESILESVKGSPLHKLITISSESKNCHRGEPKIVV